MLFFLFVFVCLFGFSTFLGVTVLFLRQFERFLKIIRALRIFQTAAFLPLSVKLLAEDQSALLRFLM